MLVILNSAKEPIGAEYTPPLKLFEYMASGTPIVAARVFVIKEIISESEAAFFEPDNVTDLAQSIGTVFADEDGAKKKSAVASMRAADYSWEKRAVAITHFIAK